MMLKKIDEDFTRIDSNKYLTFEDTENNNVYALLKDNTKQAYSVIDEKNITDLCKYTWHYHTGTGYFVHSFTKNTRKLMGVEDDLNNIYLHAYILKYCKKIIQTDNTVDHINWKKNDNREVNLRWASQAQQNSNRDARADKKKPFDELIAIGINKYPKYIRFDNSQKRFIIERHPYLLEQVQNKQINKPQINGTRTGSLIDKLKDICIKGCKLDDNINIDIYRNEMNEQVERLRNEFNEIYAFCNDKLKIDIGNKEYFAQPLFEEIVALIEESENIEGENWIDFTPGEFTYKVSDKGRIKLLNGTITEGSRIKNTKYSQVQIAIDMKTETAYNKKKYYVHKLVYEAFNGDTSKSQIVYDDNAPKIDGAYRNWLEDMQLYK